MFKYLVVCSIFLAGSLSGAVAYGAMTSGRADLTLPLPVRCAVWDMPCHHTFPDDVGAPDERPGPVGMPGAAGGDLVYLSRSRVKGTVVLTVFDLKKHRMQSLYLKGKHKLITCAFDNTTTYPYCH
jgi:hypothetical protein